MLWFILLVVIVKLIHYYLTKPLDYWKDKGICFVKPLPFLGNMGKHVFRKQSFAELTKNLYDQFPDERYIGFFQMSIPALIIKDLDLIKQTLVKDFDVFPQRRTFIPEEVEPIWGKNLFQMPGDRWRDMRATLSPTFTSSKMRAMYHLMVECAEQFVDNFSKKDSHVITVELKDAFSRCTNDVIATTAFGLNCDSLQDPNNRFYQMGKILSDFSGRKGLKLFIYSLTPVFLKFFKVRIYTDDEINYFGGIIKDAMKLREREKIIRPDMIHLLMEAQKGRLKTEEAEIPDTGFATVNEQLHVRKDRKKSVITDDDIIAQAIIFFIAGFDTSSTLMCHMGYELAMNPDIQERLIAEVDSCARKCNGKVSYEILMEMKYLDMVISETLRKWPPATTLDRQAVETYSIPATKLGEKPVTLEKGSIIFFPVFGVHRDPKYYPDPEKFDPERFNDKNKQNIKPGSYIPFGYGPRTCIGSRFALMEAKIFFFYILSHFEFVPVQKTAIPLVISKEHFNLHAEGGYWIGLKKRQLHNNVTIL